MSRITAGAALALALVLGALALGACADDPLDEPEPVATATEVGECGSLSRPVLEVLATRIVVGEATLNVNSIPATTAEDTWFVAGEIEGEGYEGPDDVALWATTTDPEGEDAGLEFTAVNDLAIEGSDWDPEEEVTEDDPAVEELFACVAERG